MTKKARMEDGIAICSLMSSVSDLNKEYICCLFVQESWCPRNVVEFEATQTETSHLILKSEPTRAGLACLCPLAAKFSACLDPSCVGN